MKKVYLAKVVQHDTTYYVGEADPRKLVKMAKEIEIGETQDAQRPLSGKRVKDIAKYVDEEKGVLPTSLVLATNDPNLLQVEELTVAVSDDEDIHMWYIEIPDADDEFDSYKNKIDVMDGQHRLYSFADDYRTFDDNISYSIPFSLFITPTLKERQLIFKNTNEKQEKVSVNLLMWFRQQLGLLQGNEKEFYGLVNKLNSENASPLKDRIIMSAERKTNGIKASSLINVMAKTNLDQLMLAGNKLDDDKRFKLICEYLKGWEKKCGVKFNEHKAENGAATKIAGIRFILALLPTFWSQSIQQQQKFDEKFVCGLIDELFTDLGVSGNELFTKEDNKPIFGGESPTMSFARECASRIDGFEHADFDPLG